MQCPRDQAELQVESHEDIEIDRCPQCRGGWLDDCELSQLEATVESTDEQRSGMIEYANHELGALLPEVRQARCRRSTTAPTTSSSTCATSATGSGSTQGEAIRVREIVEDRVEGLERAVKAEAEWGSFIDDLKDGPSFWDRLTGKG